MSRQQQFEEGRQAVIAQGENDATKGEQQYMDELEGGALAEFRALDVFKKAVGPFLFTPQEMQMLTNEYISAFHRTQRSSPSVAAGGKRRRHRKTKHRRTGRHRRVTRRRL